MGACGYAEVGTPSAAAGDAAPRQAQPAAAVKKAQAGAWAPALEAVKRALSGRPDAGEVLFLRSDYRLEGTRDSYFWALWQGDDFVVKELKSEDGTNNPSRAPCAHLWGKGEHLYWDSDGNKLEVYERGGGDDFNNSVVASVTSECGILRQALSLGLQVRQGSLEWSNRCFLALSDDGQKLKGELLGDEQGLFHALRLSFEMGGGYSGVFEYDFQGPAASFYPCSISRYVAYPEKSARTILDKTTVFFVTPLTNNLAPAIFLPSTYIGKPAGGEFVYKSGNI